MKIIAEKDRSFIDKGKIKLYNSFTGTAESGGLFSLQKVIIQPNGREKIKLINDLQPVLIILSGTIEIKGVLPNDLMLSDAALIMGKQPAGISLRNSQENDAELIILNIKGLNLKNDPQQIQLTSQITPASQDIENSRTSEENKILISKIFYQRNDAFNYIQMHCKKILTLYIISGEADINGNTLHYNDTVIFEAGEDQVILADFKKDTELLIIEIPL